MVGLLLRRLLWIFAVSKYLTKFLKKGAFTNSVGPDDIRVCAICHVMHILGNGGHYEIFNESGHFLLR